MTRYPIEQNWNLCILEYGEKSPLEDHHSFELAADNDAKEVWAAAVLVRTYGLDSVLTACRGYIRHLKKRA